MKNLLLKYARQADKASLFNHASMAHNNHFFFKTLTPDPKPMPSALAEMLKKDFSSIETLRREMIATATAMFGPGFVWLVQTDDQKFRLLTTYLAGSPYPGAHYRRQESIPAFSSPGEHSRFAAMEVANSVGAHGRFSDTKKSLPPGGIDLTPVLCVNTWEHVWLKDWGVTHKDEFVAAWWDRIDWDVVSNMAKTGVTNFIKR